MSLLLHKGGHIDPEKKEKTGIIRDDIDAICFYTKCISILLCHVALSQFQELGD